MLTDDIVTSTPTQTPARAKCGAEEAKKQLLERVHQDSFALMWRLKHDADETCRALSLKPLEVLTLKLLSEGARYPKDLAEALDAAPPVISTLLRGLEAKGLLERNLDPSDHRRVFLVLTGAGRETYAQARRTWRALQSEKLARLSVAQLRTLEHVQRIFLETR